MKALKLIITGLVIGIANVIPGVSGGTMAVVFGIYDRLIGVITLNVKKILSEWKFWLPLACGMGIGIILFSKLITFLFEQYPVYTCCAFSGIVAGSLPLVYRRCCAPSATKRLPSFSVVVCMLVSFAVMISLMLVNTESFSNGTVQTVFSLPLALKLAVGGFLAAVAMIIPGISGSFLLLVIGMYATVVASVADMNIPLILPIAVGAVIGLFSGSGFIRFLMAKVPQHTYGFILGLVVGSIFTVLPVSGFVSMIQGASSAASAVVAVAISIVCFAVGFVLAIIQKEEN